MSIFDEREKLRPYEYPHLIGYGRSIRKAFWDFDHFPYDRDVTDFKTKLTDFERQVIERSMIAIGVVENKVKSFWARIDMRMPKKEIADVGHTFAGNEVIHGDTYAELLDLLGLSELFETVEDIPAMQDRYAYLRKYLGGINSRSNKEFTKSLILFTLLVENCSLFVSFLTVSSFYKYKNVLENFNSVITATSKEECYIEGTEIFTPRGWVNILDVKIGDEVYQWNAGALEIAKTTNCTKRLFKGDMVSFDKRGHQCVVTPNHNMVSFGSKKNRIDELAIDWREGNSRKYIADSFTSNELGRSSELTTFEKLLVAIQADGTRLYWINAEGEKVWRGKSGGFNYGISIEKPRKIERLDEILSELDVEFTKTPFRDSGFRYKLKINNESNYKSFDWVKIDKINKEWALDFCEELSKWDGFVTETGLLAYSSTDKQNIDKAQCVGILAGYRTTISKKIDDRKESYKDSYRLRFNESNGFKRSHSITKGLIPYEGMVGCVTVPSGVIMTRYEDKTFVSGNCLHGKFGAELVNIIRAEFPEWFDNEMEQKIRRAIRKAYKAEVKVLDWVMEGGELDWISKDEIMEFLKQRLNDSLTQMKYDPEYELDNKLLEKSEYMQTVLHSSIDGDFFNGKLTDYTKSSITEDSMW